MWWRCGGSPTVSRKRAEKWAGLSPATAASSATEMSRPRLVSSQSSTRVRTAGGSRWRGGHSARPVELEQPRDHGRRDRVAKQPRGLRLGQKRIEEVTQRRVAQRDLGPDVDRLALERDADEVAASLVAEHALVAARHHLHVAAHAGPGPQRAVADLLERDPGEAERESQARRSKEVLTGRMMVLLDVQVHRN